MRELLGVVAGLIFSSTVFFFWYHEMFSDGPVGEFSRSFDSGRGKNFTALTQPVFIVLNISASMMLITGFFTSRSAREVARMNSPWRVWALFWAIMCLFSLLVLAISFIPFTLPEWMYPEYHAAKREEQRRREAAERGEIEDRNPFLDDNGVYTSQLGNVPIDIPEAVGLPATGDPPPLQGPPETEEPALYDSDTTDAFDITATTAALPHTGAPTSNGARPARASCAYRGPQEDRDTAVAHSTAEQAARIEE
ncbi:hypothetical protein [Schaalia georgiae]|uniref:hypothetical protein n=1 Tax=Schaalia georgiae TaxID=52768 RepID=UPI001FB0E6B2|nr:hypothetical protein [Schaalia georgiae]